MFSQFKENMEINQGIHGPNQIKKRQIEKGLDRGSTPKNIVQGTALKLKEPKCQEMLFLKLAERRANIKRTLQKNKKRSKRDNQPYLLKAHGSSC